MWKIEIQKNNLLKNRIFTQLEKIYESHRVGIQKIDVQKISVWKIKFSKIDNEAQFWKSRMLRNEIS